MKISLSTKKLLPSFLILTLLCSLTSWKLYDYAVVLTAMAVVFSDARKDFIKNNPIPKWFNYGILLWISVVFLGYFTNSPMEIDQWEDIFSLRWLLAFYILSYALHYKNVPSKNFNKLFGCISITLLAGVCWHFYAFYYLPHNAETDFRMKGFFHNTNHYSLTISLLWSYLFGWLAYDFHTKNKISLPGILALLIATLCLFAALGRSAWLGCLGAALVAIFVYRKNWAILKTSLLFTLFLGTLVAFNVWSIRDRILYSFDMTIGNANSLRIILWKTNWQIFLDHPFLGVGLYENIHYLQDYYSKLGLPDVGIFTHAHNQYLQLLAGTGILGLTAYLIIFLSGLLFFYKRFRRGNTTLQQQSALSAFLVLVTFLLSSLTESPLNLHEPRNMLMLLVAASLAWGRNRNPGDGSIKNF